MISRSTASILRCAQNDRWGTAGLALLLGLLTLLVYLPVRHHEFIAFDDPNYITDNPMVQAGLTWAGVKWAFTAGYFSYWHPLTWLSHQLDVEKVAALQPANAEVHNNLGSALLAAGRLDDAIARFEIAVRLKPDEPIVRDNLTSALLRRERARAIPTSSL